MGLVVYVSKAIKYAGFAYHEKFRSNAPNQPIIKRTRGNAAPALLKNAG